MLTRYMTDEELLKEIRQDDEWLTERRIGLRIKNHKKLNSNNYKDGDIVSFSSYTTPNGNRAHLAAMMNIQYTPAPFKDLSMSSYIESDFGFFIPAMGMNSSHCDGYLFFTRHSISRLNERFAKTFKEFFLEDYVCKNRATCHMTKYEYNGDTDEYVCRIGDCFLICNIHSRENIIVKTILTKEQLHPHQLELLYESKSGGEENTRILDMQLNDYIRSMNRQARRRYANGLFYR